MQVDVLGALLMLYVATSSKASARPYFILAASQSSESDSRSFGAAHDKAIATTGSLVEALDAP